MVKINNLIDPDRSTSHEESRAASPRSFNEANHLKMSVSETRISVTLEYK